MNRDNYHYVLGTLVSKPRTQHFTISQKRSQTLKHRHQLSSLFCVVCLEIITRKTLFENQSMDELDLDDFRYGGVNMTGFRLVDPADDKVQVVQREWSRLNPNYWRGAGTDRKIKVRISKPLCENSL